MARFFINAKSITVRALALLSLIIGAPKAPAQSPAQSRGPALFAALPPGQRLAIPDRGASSREVLRTRYAALNLDLLDEAAHRRARGPLESGRGGARRLELNLFDDVSLDATVVPFSQSEDGRTVSWTGTIDGHKHSAVAIAVTGDVVSGTFKTDQGQSFQLRTVSPGTFALREVDENRLPPEADPIPVTHLPAASADLPAALHDDGSIIEVLVVYTPAARTAAGGQTQIENLIDLAVTETNQGYANSGVIQRVRLVRKEVIT